MQTKSCELDPISTHVLKWILPVLISIITHIINTSLNNASFCKEWKTSIVRPLLKKKGLDLLDKNLRPVSNLPFLSKLVEWAALLQLNQHCSEQQLLPDFPSVKTRKQHWNISNKMMNDLLWGMEKKEITAVIILHMLAVFDTVNHDLFLTILQNRYGITDTTLRWYENYLRPRGMRVVSMILILPLEHLTICPPGKCKWGKPFYGFLCPNRICNSSWHHYQWVCRWPLSKKIFHYR